MRWFLVVLLFLYTQMTFNQAKRVNYIVAERKEVEINPSHDNRENETSIQVTWMPLYCKVADKPSVCELYTCSVTFAGGIENYRLKPYFQQGYYTNCTALAADLKGMDEGVKYNWRFSALVRIREAAKKRYEEIRKNLPYPGCAVLELPKVEDEDQWGRCVKYPFQKEDSVRNYWNQLTYTATLKNGKRESETYLLPNGKENGDTYFVGFEDRGAFSRETMSKYVQPVMLDRPCYHELQFRNKLPVAVTMQITVGGKAHDVVLKPNKENLKWGFWQSWYSVIVSDRRTVTVDATITKIDSPKPITLDPKKMKMTTRYEAKKYACFNKKEIGDSFLLVS